MYLSKTLSSNEEIKYKARMHWINYIIPLFTVVVLFWTVIFLIVGIIVLLRLLKTEMVCTTKRVIFKTGIIAVKTDELRNNKIESISMRQGIWGRILGYGDIIFTGTGNQMIVFKAVKSPVKTKSCFEQIIETYKS